MDILSSVRTLKINCSTTSFKYRANVRIYNRGSAHQQMCHLIHSVVHDSNY